MAYRNRDYGGSNYGPRQMYDAVCSSCGNPCQVPFRPIEGRPVYCRDCYVKMKSGELSPQE